MGYGEVSFLCLACGFASVIGHIYPVYHGFKGGKSAGTLIGVLLALPLPALIVPSLILVWLGVIMLSGYVGLGTIVTSICFPLYLYLTSNSSQELIVFSIICSLLIIFTHRSNIFRMINGNENQFQKIMLFKNIFQKKI